ncbi:odorant receptor 30a-like [Aricia agestis]|uniref:odorant receptor 30a-like n=1 Tax=Aricia agestis TaxID=91739 RepID=UPI001C2063B8|nr:odorant receptor 30a-like [Aricia agestis]
MERGGQIDVIYTDFEKAFDRVDHLILLKKLQELGIHGDLLRWMESYLSNRSQAVVMGGYRSDYIEMPTGVPQGSHLGPLLYNAYLYDIGVDSLVMLPCFVIIGDDARLRVAAGDVPNLIRQLIVLIAISYVRLKMFLSIFHAKLLRNVLDVISRDYQRFNVLPEEYQQLVDKNIRMTKKFQYTWGVAIASTLLSFIVLALGFTVYSQVFSATPRKYMIHECRLISLAEGEQYLTPYYELFAAYSVYVLWEVFVGFIAYDGIYILSILHVSLRLKIVALDLSRVACDVTPAAMTRRIVEFVRDHCEVQRFITKVEKCFQVWLIMLVFNAILQIVMSLSQTTKKNDSDYKTMYYLLFVAVALHTYLLCYLTSYVTYNGEELAMVAYSTGWEAVPDTRVRRSLVMLMMRAQKPTQFKAMGMMTINMELFTKILQTSYSIFTILRK